MAKSKRKSSSTSRGSKKSPSTSKKNQLTPLDLVIAATFIGSVIFSLVAFSTATHPLNDLFVVWPAIIGAAIGLVLGVFLYKLTNFESLAFMLGVMVLAGALLGISLVLTFNRSLDESPPVHHFVTVEYKFDQGNIRNRRYFLDVKDFQTRRIKVEEDVYNGTTVGEKVDVITRQGFFGYPYLDKVQLVSLDLHDAEQLPKVAPTIPIGKEPGGPGGK